MNKFAKIFLVISVSCFVFLFSSAYVSAQGSADCPYPGAPGCPPAGGGGATPEVGSSGSTGGSVSLTNPLDITDPNEIIGNVIRAILGIVGSLALAIFIFGGFTWVISAGNEEKIKKGKDMILWATLGLVVIFFSYAMVTFVLSAIGGST